MFVVIAAAVPFVVSVAMKKMHQEAREQQQIGQNPEKVGAVLGQQKETGNRKKANEHPFSP